MKETAKLASKQISTQLKSYRDIAHEIGAIAKLSSSEVSLKGHPCIIDSRLTTYR